MQLGNLDYFIIIAVLAVTLGTALYSKQFMRSSADFLAANRLAGRYLLNIASSFLGAVSIVNMWEMSYATGLPPQWWGRISAPVGTIIMLTGFVIYRYRQTRSLTLAQFFEVRYSRNFRLFAGFLCWLSGLLNYGIFPLVTAKFLISFIGLPERFSLFGISVGTFSALIVAYLAISVYIACSGGMISIMINGFVQNSFVILVMAGVLVFMCFKFSWPDIFEGLKIVDNPDASMIDPFKESTTREFNVNYYLMSLFGAFYGVMAWQGGSGYGSAARTPHEAVAANVWNSWRYMSSSMSLLLVPLMVYALLHLEKYAPVAAPIKEAIAASGDARIQAQMTVPIALSRLLPSGLFGMFVAVILCCAITCDSTYTHSWGTILVQDVIAPLRGKPFSPKTHMLIMRLAIAAVAVFGFVFSELYTQKSFITMYFSLTAAIYVGGAGAVIIGGLYWKRGTTAGAWTAMCIGTIIGFGGLVLVQIWEEVIDAIFGAKAPEILYEVPLALLIVGVALGALALLFRRYERFKAGVKSLCVWMVVFLILSAGMLAFFEWIRDYVADNAAAQNWYATSEYAHHFFLTEAWIGCYASVFAVIGYVAVSLLGKRGVHDMDKLLHRGKYAVASDTIGAAEAQRKEKFSWRKLIGIGEGFSRGEKILFTASFGWMVFWYLTFVAGCVYRYLGGTISEGVWSVYWAVNIYSQVVIGVAATVWVFCGGIVNARELFRDLKKARVDENDDGFVR